VALCPEVMFYLIIFDVLVTEVLEQELLVAEEVLEVLLVGWGLLVEQELLVVELLVVVKEVLLVVVVELLVVELKKVLLEHMAVVEEMLEQELLVHMVVVELQHVQVDGNFGDELLIDSAAEGGAAVGGGLAKAGGTGDGSVIEMVVGLENLLRITATTPPAGASEKGPADIIVLFVLESKHQPEITLNFIIIAAPYNNIVTPSGKVSESRFTYDTPSSFGVIITCFQSEPDSDCKTTRVDQ